LHHRTVSGVERRGVMSNPIGRAVVAQTLVREPDRNAPSQEHGREVTDNREEIRVECAAPCEGSENLVFAGQKTPVDLLSEIIGVSSAESVSFNVRSAGPSLAIFCRG
jgi:hypothetical protein